MSYFEPIYKHHYLLFNKGGIIKNDIHLAVINGKGWNEGSSLTKGMWGVMDSIGNIVIPPLAASYEDIRAYTKYINESKTDLEMLSLVTDVSNEHSLKIYNSTFRLVFDVPILNKHFSHDRLEYNNHVYNVFKARLRDSSDIIILLDRNGNVFDTFNGMKQTTGPLKLLKKQSSWYIYDLSYDHKIIYQFEEDSQKIDIIGTQLLMAKGNELSITDLSVQPLETKKFHIPHTNYTIFNEHPYICSSMGDSLLIQSTLNGKQQMINGNRILFTNQTNLLSCSNALYDTSGNFIGRHYTLIDREGKVLFSKSLYGAYIQKANHYRTIQTDKLKHRMYSYDLSNGEYIFTNKLAYQFGDSLLMFEDRGKQLVLDSSYNLIDYNYVYSIHPHGEWYSVHLNKRIFLFNERSELVADKRANSKRIKNYDFSINYRILHQDTTFRVFKTHCGNIYLINLQTSMICKLSDKASKFSFSMYDGVLRFKKGNNWFYVNRNSEIFYKTKGCGKIKISPISLNQFKKQYKRPFWH